MLEGQFEGVLLHISLSHILALRSMRKRCERRKRRDTNNEKHPVVVNKTRVWMRVLSFHLQRLAFCLRTGTVHCAATLQSVCV